MEEKNQNVEGKPFEGLKLHKSVEDMYDRLKTYELQKFLFTPMKENDRCIRLSNDITKQLDAIVKNANKIGNSTYKNKAALNMFINNILQDFLEKYNDQIIELQYEADQKAGTDKKEG